jgi:hypothetical protein
VKPQEHLNRAIQDMDIAVKDILSDQKLSLTEKDKLIFPYIKKRKVLQQAIEDLNYLDERGEVPVGDTCKMSQYR